MANGKLTTHVLDLKTGFPANALRIELWKDDAKIADVVTNDDGRVDAPLLTPETISKGVFELRFHAGDYLKNTGLEAEEPLFLDIIPIRFGINDVDRHYHVPLLLSPFGYSTYRGS